MALRCPARPAVVAVAVAAARSHTGQPPALPQVAPARPGFPARARAAVGPGCSGRGDAAEARGGRPEELGWRAGSAALGPRRPLSWRFVGTERNAGAAAA